MQVAIQEALPSLQSISSGAEQQSTVAHRIRKFVEVEHVVVPPIDPDDHVELEIPEGVRVALRLDRDEIYVPRVATTRINLHHRPVGPRFPHRARIGKSHANVEQDEHSLHARATGPWLGPFRQLELVGDDIIMLSALTTRRKQGRD